MDKDFVKGSGLSEAVRRFNEIAGYKSPAQSIRQLNEYTFVSAGSIDEDDDEGDGELQQPQGGQGQPHGQPQDAQGQAGGQYGAQTGGGMPQDAQGAPQDGMQMPQGGGEMPQDGMQMPQDAQGAPQDGIPQDDMGQDMDDDGLGFPDTDEEGIETDEMEPGDEVIDVDELTQSQEATEYKIDGVDDRLAKIFSVVQKFSDKLDRQESEIMSLRSEFEKRNPTPEEKLNIRSQSSYPYSELPKDYWDRKSQENPNYNVIYDNEVSPSDEQERYEVKRSDISGLDMRNISDTLNIDQKLSDYIGF